MEDLHWHSEKRILPKNETVGPADVDLEPRWHAKVPIARNWLAGGITLLTMKNVLTDRTTTGSENSENQLDKSSLIQNIIVH